MKPELNSDIDLLIDKPSASKATVILAHGAGAAMDSPFMNSIASALVEFSYEVVRFEFPYMARGRATGKKKPPDRLPKLIDAWHSVLKHFENKPLFIGGKSMGGRIASMIADEADVCGLICLGYPFHPIGKPDNLRIDHLQSIVRPTLILQGTRDKFGDEQQVVDYQLSRKIRIVWLEDGDHSFKPRKASGRTEDQNLRQAAEEIDRFVKRILR